MVWRAASRTGPRPPCPSPRSRGRHGSSWARRRPRRRASESVANAVGSSSPRTRARRRPCRRWVGTDRRRPPRRHGQVRPACGRGTIPSRRHRSHPLYTHEASVASVNRARRYRATQMQRKLHNDSTGSAPRLRCRVSASAAEWARRATACIPFHLGDINLPTPDNVVEAMNRAIADGKTGYCAAAGIARCVRRWPTMSSTRRGLELRAGNIVPCNLAASR